MGSTMIREMLGMAEGILQDLHNDHGDVDALIADIWDCEDSAQRGRLFSEMRSKLLARLKAKQEVLNQPLEAGKDEESRRFGHEGTSEHQIIEQQIHKMAQLGDRMSDEWTAELKVLQDLIEHHNGEEESTGFSCARDEFGTDQLEAMRPRFQARKAALMTQIA